MTAEACTGEGCYFLSYSRADEKIALRLASDLRDWGVAMWLDQLDIRPSEHWDRAIERAVRECRGLVVILSPRSVASDNVADEISFAIDSGKSVLPVMIERCTLPLRLTRMQVVDATDNYERALQQCVDELTRRDGEPVVRKAPEPAPVALDAGDLSAAKQRLAQILGPIAGRLVDKSAARAASIAELYRLLAANIPNAAEREAFLALGGAASVQGTAPSPPPRQSAGAGIAKADLESMAELMARYIGPIARVVVTREGRASDSVEQLRRQLAVHIPDQRERAEFLREAERR
jgi:TIR domain-containing protein